MYVQAYMWIND